MALANLRARIQINADQAKRSLRDVSGGFEEVYRNAQRTENALTRAIASMTAQFRGASTEAGRLASAISSIGSSLRGGDGGGSLTRSLRADTEARRDNLDVIYQQIRAQKELLQAGGSGGLIGGLQSGLFKGLVGGSIIGAFVGGITNAIGGFFSAVFDGVRNAIERAFDIGRASLEKAGTFDSNIRALATVSTGADDLRRQLSALTEIGKLPGINFENAVQASIALQSVGKEAQFAERAIAAIGNALASAGKGPADLKEIATQLQQTFSSGKIEADNLKPIIERMPQAARVLLDAFGTINSGELNKLGVGTVIDGLVSGLERLPKATGGIKNTLENLGDLLARTQVSLGRGVGAAIEGALPRIEGLFGTLDTAAARLGDVVAAVGTSGVLGDVIERFTQGIVGAGSSLSVVPTILGGISSVLAGLPNFIQTVFHNTQEIISSIRTGINYVTESFRLEALAVSLKFRAVFESIGEAFRTPQPGLFFNPITTMNTAISGINSAFQGIEAGLHSAYKRVPDFQRPRLQELPNLLQDKDAFASRIGAAIRPLSDIPSGLSFGNGGFNLDGSPKGTGGGGEIDAILAAIERNTGKTAKSLSDLAQKAVGGGELARQGLTPAQIRRLGGRGYAPPQEDYGHTTPLSDIRRSLRRVTETTGLDTDWGIG